MPRCANEVVEQNGICEKEKFVETLPNGVSHSILNFMRQTVDDTPVYHVPVGHYFFWEIIGTIQVIAVYLNQEVV